MYQLESYVRSKLFIMYKKLLQKKGHIKNTEFRLSRTENEIFFTLTMERNFSYGNKFSYFFNAYEKNFFFLISIFISVPVTKIRKNSG
jgi:hypothetical protein